MLKSFRPVPGFDHRYWARDDGTIWVFRQLKATPRGSGHLSLQVVLPDGTRSIRHVHALVAAAFHGESDLPLVRHLDGNPLNNAPSNLAWGTHAENSRDMIAQGRSVSKLSVEQVRELVLRFDHGEAISALAEAFGVSYNVANSHARRRSEISRVALGL